MAKTKAEANIETSRKQLESIGETVNDPLLEKIVKNLGIANMSKNGSLVAASDKTEVERLKNNFLKKKLGVSDDAQADSALEEVLGRLSDIRQKMRGAVYYLLTVKFGKEGVYIK